MEENVSSAPPNITVSVNRFFFFFQFLVINMNFHDHIRNSHGTSLPNKSVKRISHFPREVYTLQVATINYNKPPTELVSSR